MFDNWYVVQVRTGKEEEIVKKCQYYIDHDILIDCFIPITKKKKKYQGTWHIVDDILFKGYIFMITNQVEQLYTQLKKSTRSYKTPWKRWERNLSHLSTRSYVSNKIFK